VYTCKIVQYNCDAYKVHTMNCFNCSSGRSSIIIISPSNSCCISCDISLPISSMPSDFDMVSIRSIHAATMVEESGICSGLVTKPAASSVAANLATRVLVASSIVACATAQNNAEKSQ
jgi:hypothetical protein